MILKKNLKEVISMYDNGIRKYTYEEQRRMKEESLIRRRELYAKKRDTAGITTKKKIDRAIQKISNMAVTRFERLLIEQLRVSGYSKSEIEYVIKNKHYKQTPIVESEEEEETELAFHHMLWKPIKI
jgi:hypothetical protein